MEQTLRILNLEDSETDSELIQATLEEEGIACELTRVETEKDYVSALDRGGFDLLLVDYKLPSFDGMSALAIARERCPDIPFIFVSGSIGEDIAIDALKSGATDYVLKDKLARLPAAVRRALKENEGRVERRKLEDELRQAQKMEAIGRLAGGIAHDFNNMLGVILGYAELAMMHADEKSPLHGQLTEIIKAGQRSADLTRQLLAFARKQVMAPKVLDLNKMIGQSEKMLRRMIGEDIDLKFSPGEDLWQVNMDPSQVDQILANLAVNARDAIKGVGAVTIETQNALLDDSFRHAHEHFIPGEYVILSFSDNGCGMDRETVARIFDPFFTTKSEGKGTGLGLATVYGIVTQNRGFINVYSEPGAGTTFRIYIPRHAGAEAAIEEEAAIHVLTGTETILLVEDEQELLNICASTLKGLGYTVLTANRPEEAIRISETHQGPLHLLISDVIMPQMHGKELQQRIAAMRSGIRTLFMSGYASNALYDRGILEPDLLFLQKPFSLSDFSRKVREALEKKA
ncbi:MAG: response regulator [Nitrospirae bacterium]|nr:response regulator [Nitrospirota bacterium]